MLKVLLTIYFAFRSAFKSQSQLEAEIVSLRHQLNIALRKRSCRVQLSNFDRSFLVGISRAFPTVLESVESRAAGNGHPLAPARGSALLALEVPRSAPRTPQDR